jgi:hypothetical protein
MTLNATQTAADTVPLTPRPTMPAPTPWRWSVSGKPTGKSLARFHIYVEDKDGRKIAAVWGKDGEREATANLLVAAPTMRAALLDIGDLANKTLEGEAIFDRIALRDIILRCAEALARTVQARE